MGRTIIMNKQTLLTHNRFKYQHIKLAVLETDEHDNVLAFAGLFYDHKFPGEELSRGIKEVNHTLWSQSSTKRPKGFWVLATHGYQGWLRATIMVSDAWFAKPTVDRFRQEQAWQQNTFDWAEVVK